MRLFASQCLAYLIATLSIRFVAAGSLAGVGITDAMLASMSFYAIREVAEKRGTALQYVAGSVVGGLAGMLVGR